MYIHLKFILLVVPFAPQAQLVLKVGLHVLSFCMNVYGTGCASDTGLLSL